MGAKSYDSMCCLQVGLRQNLSVHLRLSNCSLILAHRKRHLRCDEGKPACWRCMRSNLECVYSGSETSAILLQPYPLYGLCSGAAPVDREAFYVMRTGIFTSFAGPYEKDFWIMDAVRAVQSHPAVWYAGLALTEIYRTAAHEEIGPGGGLSYRIRAMENYGRAVRSILDVTRQADISLADKKAVLLSSIMLIGFCCVQKFDVEATLAHFRNAFLLHNKWRIWECLGDSFAQDDVVRTSSIIKQFQRFESHFAANPVRITESEGEIRARASFTFSSAFTSATAAYTEFIHILPLFLIVMKDVSGAIMKNEAFPEDVHFGRLLLTSWKTKFVTFLHSQHIEGAEKECILSLQIWTITLEIGLFRQNTGALEAELAFDMWNPSFKRIVELAEELCATIRKIASKRQQQPFCFTTSLVLAFALVG